MDYLQYEYTPSLFTIMFSTWTGQEKVVQANVAQRRRNDNMFQNIASTSKYNINIILIESYVIVH